MDTGAHAADDDTTTGSGVAGARDSGEHSDAEPYDEYQHGIFDQGQPEEDGEDDGRGVFDQDDSGRAVERADVGEGVYDQGHPEPAGQPGQGVYDQGHSQHADRGLNDSVATDDDASAEGRHRAP